MNDVVVSVIRTWAALAAGAVITWAAARGLGFADSLRQPLADFLVAALTAGYYALVRVGETRLHRWLGFLLLVPRPPAYRKNPP